MQVIPENLNITTGYHVFETPDDIIINSQVYDKITMEPKPYNFFNTNYTYHIYENMLLHFYTKLNHYTMLPKEVNYKRYIQDTKDPSIFYFCNLYGNFVKVKKENNQYKLISSITPDSGYRPNYYNYNFNNYKILGQTDDYVILAQTHKGDNGGSYSNKMMSILRITKSTMTHTATCNIGTYLDYGVTLLKECSNHIYFFGVFNGQYYVGMYKTDTNTLTWIYTDTTFNQTNSIGISDAIEFRNDFYFITSNSTNYILRRLRINYDNNSVSIKNYNIGTHINFQFKTPNDVCYLGWLHYSLYNIDDKYISITSHDAENQIKCINNNIESQRPSTYFSSQGFHRHMICKYNENNDSFSIVSTINDLGTTRRILGVLYPTPYHIFFLEDNNITGYYFDKNTNKTIQIFNKTGNYYTMGLDETNNFYIFDSNNHCNIYNKNTSYELIAEFEQESYDYEDTNIDTYITIYSKNFLGEYINSKVQITLTGNCYFKENNSKELIIITEKEIQQIPVIITNGGTVYCYIKEVE